MQKNSTGCRVLENSTINEIAITEKEYNDILNIQSEILGMLASGGSTTETLARLCTLAESLLPNAMASIMLLNKESGFMSVLSAPSAPKIAHDALSNLKPGPCGGSCGNAVFENKAQYVEDTFNDGRWSNLRQLALDFNLCACWSMPVRNENKEVIGTFALSSFEHRSPAPFHKKLLETAAHIVNIVLKNRDNEKRIKLFSTALHNAAEGILITNEKNQIVEVNQAFESIYGLKEKDVIGLNPKVMSTGKNDKKFYKKMWEDLNTKHKWSGEIVNKRFDGSLITQWVSISALKDEQNQETHNYLAVFTDLTELKETQQKLEEMAFKDELTGLCNKTHLEKLISLDNEQTLIMLNVNNFSYINTAYGFETGDKLLIKIAEILRENFKFSHICRINSDEFALLFDTKIKIQDKISHLQNYFYNREIKIENITLNISFSYGASRGEKNLLRNSALALKQAKENGKNSFYIYKQDEDHIGHSQRESFIAMNNLLHHAIHEDMIVPFFQGIRNNKTKEIIKFEALARIEYNGKRIMPIEFLEPARLSGLLPEITKIMIEKSFKKMSENEFTFSINITEEDLSKNYIISYLEAKAKEHAIKPNRVILEILEGISSSGKKNHAAQLIELKERGFLIAIDDFGTEYSNFERVLDLEIDFLKIDGKYIKDVNTNQKSYEIVRAIAFFARNAGIPCIAEFIHSASVQKIIEELGIEYSQGYLYSEPRVHLEDAKEVI